MGLDVTVTVEMQTRVSTPYPCGVTICGEANPAQRERLQTYIEETFAVPKQRQTWQP